MSAESTVSFTDALRSVHLLEPAQLDGLNRELQARFPEPRALAGELIRRGWLTPFQVNQLMRGRAPELLLGSYVLLEKLGAGGMGQVFKARNWKLGRVVAVKVIRPERLDNADAVRRFQREIRAAAQLDHPHIVRALDADEVHGAHLLVMDYVEGTDLAKHVKQGGPLPVDRACDYARQTALGLQHAFERGLVHRDIKPQNLLLTPHGVVKILDMGLARLGHAGEVSEGTSIMTQEGAVMGTLDYIAPEQAMDSHSVDIRADLYSLGCTLYCLLTGRVPFPGGTAMEKLYRHQSQEPVPVEHARPGLPPGVGAVVRKLMAKRPAARYQTPAEAATALEAAPLGGAVMGPPAAVPLGETTLDFHPHAAAGETAQPPTLEQTVADGGAASVFTRAAERRRRLAGEQRRRFAYYAAGGVLSLVLAVFLGVLFLRFVLPSAKAPADSSAAGGSLSGSTGRARTFEQWLKDVAALPPNGQVEEVVDRLRIRNPGFDGQATPTVEKGVVVGLEFRADEVGDLGPLQALRGLSRLTCPGNGREHCKLNNLAPLKGLPLTALDCRRTAAADLSPLRGMPLTALACGGTFVSDLSPLHGMSLQSVDLEGTPVADLAPLRAMPLAHVDCKDTAVTDLSPLLRSPLSVLSCDFSPKWDVDQLRSVTTLKTINGKPAGAFWEDRRAFAQALLGPAGEYSAVTGVDAAGFQTWIDLDRMNGYRPLFVNGYAAAGSPRYAAVAVKDPAGPAWEVRHHLTSDEYQTTFEELAAKGYWPLSTSGYPAGDGPHFVAVWTATPSEGWEARHFLAPRDYQNKLAAVRADGSRPAFVSGFSDGAGAHFFIALFVPANGTPWQALRDLTGEQYLKAVAFWQAKGYRPTHVSAYDTTDGLRFVGVFLKDDAAGIARIGLTLAQWRAELADQLAAGYAPVSVAGYTEVRYAGVWVKQNK